MMIDNLSIIIKELGIEYPISMLEYLINTGEADRKQTEKLINVFSELANKTEEKERIMTIADNIRQEGIEQGIQQGILTGIEQNTQRTAINMLKENLNINLISKITGITEDELIKLRINLK